MSVLKSFCTLSGKLMQGTQLSKATHRHSLHSFFWGGGGGREGGESGCYTGYFVTTNRGLPEQNETIYSDLQSMYRYYIYTHVQMPVGEVFYHL